MSRACREWGSHDHLPRPIRDRSRQDRRVRAVRAPMDGAGGAPRRHASRLFPSFGRSERYRLRPFQFLQPRRVRALTASASTSSQSSSRPTGFATNPVVSGATSAPSSARCCRRPADRPAPYSLSTSSSSRSRSADNPSTWTSRLQSPRSAPALSQAQVSATVSDSARGTNPTSAARSPDIP